MMPPRDFDIGVSRQLAALDKRLSRLDSYPSGPSIGELYADFRGLLGLRGLWFPGVADNTGAVYDASGQGRTLTYNGNPTINLHNSLVPYYDLDGTGDYLSRADEAGLDILGTETYVVTALRGLTFGGWFRPLSVTGVQMLMGKYTAVGDLRSWLLYLNGVTLNGTVSSTGTTAASTTVTSSIVPAINGWYFAVVRLSPATNELAIYVNGTKTLVTPAVASLFNSTAAFQIGAANAGGNLFTGQWALGFLCAAALPDDLLEHLLSRTRTLFGI